RLDCYRSTCHRVTFDNFDRLRWNGRGRGLRLVVDLDLRLILDCTDYLVTAGDDLFAFREPAEDFNVCVAADPGFYRPENGFSPVDHEDALQFFSHGAPLCRILRRSRLRVRRRKLTSLSDRQGL